MGFHLQLLFTGIGVGSIYALVALGFALIYRTTAVVNFAQGDFAMLGAFAMVLLTVDLGVPYWLGIVITLVVMAGFGALFNLAVYYPLRNRSFLPVIISTIGASILLENGVLASYGPRPQTLDGVFPDLPGITIGDVFLDTQYIVIVVVAVVMVLLQYLFFERTLIGKKMQATAQDKEMASLVGIPVMAMIMITFMYSTVLGGLAGILVAPVLFATVGMGSTIALKAFAASIIGGFGDVRGAIAGGLALGVIETFGASVSPSYKDAFAFLLLFVFLLVRPQGIFGEPIAEKA